MSESEWVRIYLTEALSWEQASERYGIRRAHWYAAYRKHSPKYQAEIHALACRRKSLGIRRNLAAWSASHVRPPKVILDRGDLQRRMRVGQRPWAIATELGVSDYIVRRNITLHGLDNALELGSMPRVVTAANLDLLERAELLVPGLVDLVRTSADSWEAVEALYVAHLKLLEVSALVKRVGNRVQKRHPVKVSRVTWSSNMGEARLALCLEYEGVRYARQVAVCKERGLMVDFLVEDCLVVEVDGDYHRQPDTIARDATKEALCRDLGLSMLRIPRHTVDRNPEEALELVLSKLSELKR